MFKEKIGLEEHTAKISEYRDQIRQTNLNHELEIKKLEFDHELSLKQKEFDLKHFKDDAIKALRAELNKADQKIAVLEKENEMLVKITDLNADIIDVKKLVSDLIGKLPEVSIKGITVTNNKA